MSSNSFSGRCGIHLLYQILGIILSVSIYQILGMNKPDANLEHDVKVCKHGIGIGFGVLSSSFVTRWNEDNPEADYGTRSRVYFNMMRYEHSTGFKKVSSESEADPEFSSARMDDESRTVMRQWFQWHKLGAVDTVQLVAVHYTQTAGLFDNWQRIYLVYTDQCGSITFVCPGSYAPFQGEADLRRQKVNDTLKCLCTPESCRPTVWD